jgi:Fur family ferric uptake transcriptional regulator
MRTVFEDAILPSVLPRTCPANNEACVKKSEVYLTTCIFLQLQTVMTKSNPHADLPHTIRQRGFRMTPQRQLILDAVMAGKGHSTPDQIYTRVAKKAPALNRATVYRTLDFLAAQHIITCADIGIGSKVYEMSTPQPHHHLVCERCGNVEQVNHDVMAPAFKHIEHAYAFKVTTDHLALFGLCRRCQRST